MFLSRFCRVTYLFDISFRNKIVNQIRLPRNAAPRFTDSEKMFDFFVRVDGHHRLGREPIIEAR